MDRPDLDSARWRTSSYSSSQGNCVEVAVTAHVVGVRDSKARTGGTLHFPTTSWTRFMNAMSTR